jgi:carbamate kinase
MKKLAVVAFGGNALLRENQAGSINEQEQNILDTCNNLLYLIKKDFNLVIAHGNGPQVGNSLLRHEAGESKYKIPAMPMDICVAETQGYIGYLIEQQLRNVLVKNNIDRHIISIITQVVVDRNDPAFKNPTKPVGPFYSKKKSELIAKENDCVFSKDPRGRGWRRVVASPRPVMINNWNVVKRNALKGTIVISCGGGGIPVYINDKNEMWGLDAVIDKDLASAELGLNIKADELFILTDVPYVYINFRKPDEKILETITVSQAKQYLEEGQFAEGSMAPKVRAGIHFVEKGGKKTIITQASSLSNKKVGTRIVNN